MLSGIKIIPKDQLHAPDSAEEIKNSTKKEKKRRRDSECSLYLGDGSDSLGSETGSEEGRSKKKMKMKGKRNEKGFVSSGSSSSSSSDEREKKRGSKKEDRKDLSDDDGSDFLIQSDKEQARKEMGLGWMLKSGSAFANSSVRNDTKQEEPPVERVQRPNPKELNPYYIDNGRGYPGEADPLGAATSQLPPSSVVGDGGASWRLKALKRAKDQAAREGRMLDEVVKERWGSLGHLAVAAQTVAPSHAHLHATKDMRRQHAPHEHRHGVFSRHSETREPKQDSGHLEKGKQQDISPDDGSLTSAAISGINKFADDGSFMGNLSRLQNKGPES